MGPLNFKSPRYMQFKWGEMHNVFEKKKHERAHLTDKERKKGGETYGKNV